MRYIVIRFAKLSCLLIFIFIFCNSSGQPISTNKAGGVCFRYDDNLPLKNLVPLTKIFDKFNYKYCLALNLEALPDTSPYLPFVQNLDRNGFELMDHCPNHCTNVFWTEKSFMYKSRPGIHHQNASNMVCLRYEPLHKNTFLSHGIVDLNKDTIVSQKNGDFKNWHNDEEYLFIPQLDLLVNPCMVSNQNPHNPDTMRILSFWGEQLFFNKQYNLDYYIINKKDIHLTEDARFVLASESGRLFKKYHIQKPSTWIQPGGKTLKFAAQEIKETFGDRKHYLCAGSDGGLQCYNDGNAYARFAMQWGDFSGGINFSADKNQIANQMAKHYFLIGGHDQGASKSVGVG